MCLHTKTDEFIKASEDITCYKAVEVLEENGKRGAFSFYFYKGIDEEVINGEKPYVPDDIYYQEPAKYLMETLVGEINYPFSWTGGVIHASKEMSDLTGLIPDFKLEIYRCVIPKGTLYLEGVDDTDQVCYGSKQIVFKELVFEKVNGRD